MKAEDLKQQFYELILNSPIHFESTGDMDRLAEYLSEEYASQLTSSIKIEWRDDVGFENIQNS